ncbi:MAG: TAXI family TRAP transporter solute-binding subunit [Dehalococcoidales bacterium]|nr:TAXI family TRAP transporter solute-binding subunit [Dehalococcoidales bacterium]
MKRRVIFGLIAAILVLSLVITACSSPSPSGQTPAAKKTNLFFGSTSSTSGTYVWAVAIANVVNTYAPNVSITVVESGATYDNARKIKEGVFEGGLADSLTAPFELSRGIESFTGQAWEPIRILTLRDLAASRLIVRADSGIKTWADLKGKKVWGGIPGSSAAEEITRANATLGTGAILVPGTLDDAVQGLSTGSIVAVHKSSNLDSFDASFMQVHVQKPLMAIGFSDDEAAKLAAKYPQFFMTKTPAGTIKTNPNTTPLWEIYVVAVVPASSRLSEEHGYQIIKAVKEHWNEVVQAYPSSGAYDPITTYLKTVPPALAVKVHAGVARYAKEIGVNIPPDFIPPEYKGK